MTQLFLLICTNELHDVVSINFCDTEKDAQEKMKLQYESEIDGDEKNVQSCCIDYDRATVVVSEGEYEYHWRIVQI